MSDVEIEAQEAAERVEAQAAADAGQLKEYIIDYI